MFSRHSRKTFANLSKKFQKLSTEKLSKTFKNFQKVSEKVSEKERTSEKGFFFCGRI